MHKNSSVYAHDVLVELHHGLPPVFPDVFFEFRPVLSVVVYGAQSVVDLAGLGHVPVLLGV